ncbi:magnesium chelatase subunit H [Prosthecochloris sp. N3]|uniref:magnesium chelatase n=1 Tax=Prosthecochloris ethylica TaxID=2743976 RepID=A0ABR9XQC5_9CHLB|nr:magnesium chelatase subunit H [Prosthecochloris ethylica]MBF0585439.1 magnesium chelatase subunit H [Prosthecochloris ethylica]MBF0636225.1 magnesium chelatase subunit H [Prosthecochloris ethylica]NUK46669.1 magnesium chelatase subunit H [Prosthecochloris ethylica]
MAQHRKIAAIVGLEQYNTNLWKKVMKMLEGEAELTQWSDVDLEKQNPETAQAISEADCVFMSMIQFKDQVQWFREQLQNASNSEKTVFIFESMPEAMALTKVGDYAVGEGKGGMPDAVKNVAKMLVKGRDEDALYGYMKLMKIMRTILPLVPKKAKDFKNWLLVYSYWMQPTAENIANMFRLILREYYNEPVTVGPIVDVPNMGLYHPDAPSYFKDVRSYKSWSKKRGVNLGKGQTVGLLFFRKHLLQEKTYIDNTIREFERQGLKIYPAFVMGVEGHVLVRDWLVKENIDLLVNMMGFGLVGGPAGSTKPGTAADARAEIMEKLDSPYIVSQPLLVQDFTSWQELGVSPMQVTFTYSIPEMDGAVCPIILGALKDGKVETVPDRIERLAGLAAQWLRLRAASNREKKLAFIVYDYPPGLGKKASAALLDVPKSLFSILERLKKEGYNVGTLPESPEELFRILDRATDYQLQNTRPDALTVDGDTYRKLTTSRERERIDERWESFPGEIVPVGHDGVFTGGVKFGNIFIGVQPRLGVQGDPMRLLFDKANTPHHQYISFYRWISREFGAHAMVHVGMHGSAEWMPGLQTGLTGDCWPDALLGEVPHFYIYPINNPSEASIAKRRGLATMVSHVVPPLSRAGLYKELPALKDLLSDYRERNLGESSEAGDVEAAILQKAELLNLTDDCPRRDGEPFRDFVSRLYSYIHELENRLISNSLHVFGEASPLDAQLVTITETLKNRTENGQGLPLLFMNRSGRNGHYASYEELARRSRSGEEDAVALREWVEECCRQFFQQVLFDRKPPQKVFAELSGGHELQQEEALLVNSLISEGSRMLQALRDNTGEMEALIRVLDGRYIPSGPGGDLVRDGVNVLPSGRNIHSIDPWRIPSELAFKRGTQIAEGLIQRHLDENDAEYPETIAQVLWGLDTIKTKGEAVAVVIRLMGAEPAYDESGKISHYRLIPLEKLQRPRIDVLMQLSPIFRDAFGLLMDQLDRLVKDAATADEPHDMNFIKKHVDASLAEGVDFESATSRQFTQSPGSYGTYVDDMVEDSAWENDDDLDELFIRRNSSAYGGERKGENKSEILKSLLGTVDRVVHQVDSTEFGISDIDHYFSSSGSLQLAARKRNTRSGGNVRLNYVESFTSDIKLDDANKALRVEYRSKLLNPKWFEGMMKHGHSGATEISNRVTYMLGWDAVTQSVDDWVYKKTAETYALDPEMRERLAEANPQAIKNIVGRMLEAHGRGMWKADQNIIDELQEIYADLEDRLEGMNDDEGQRR